MFEPDFSWIMIPALQRFRGMQVSPDCSQLPLVVTHPPDHSVCMVLPALMINPALVVEP